MRLSARQKRAIRHLWKSEFSLEEVCDEMELSTDTFVSRGEACEVRRFTLDVLHSIATDMALPERTPHDIYLPSESEIRVAAARIRAGWTQQEREERLKSAWRG